MRRFPVKNWLTTTFERYHKLFNEQAVTRQEFDIRQTEKELATQGVARAEARLKQAQEVSRAATTMADYTRIVAPITGVITSKQADLGRYRIPGPAADDNRGRGELSAGTGRA